MSKLIYLSILLFSLQSCQRIFIQQRLQHATQNNCMLASIGETSGNLLTKDFKNKALPTYKNPIRVAVTYPSFSQQIYKAYKKATKQQNQIPAFTYDKEAKKQPVFIQIQIADQETLIDELNQEYNNQLIGWLKENPKAKVLTGMSMYMPTNIIKELKKADKIVVVNKSYKDYTLELYKNNKPYKSIAFSKGVVFGYTLSSFCWGQTRGINWEIKALTKEYNSCYSEQYKSYKKAVKSKEINFKF